MHPEKTSKNNLLIGRFYFAIHAVKFECLNSLKFARKSATIRQHAIEVNPKI